MTGTPQRGRKLSVVVCGTTFGQFYLSALGASGFPFELTGILGRSSERSQDCAARYGVPLFTDTAQIPDHTDIACVVVRSGAVGGPGGKLTESLLARGIHVLQEHPVHRDELIACLHRARASNVVYHLNTLYPHLGPVRRFLAAGVELLRRQQPLFVDAACSIQVAYPLLDILGRLLGGVRPWAFTAHPQPAPELAELAETPLPFRSLDGVIGGVPCTLRVQNELDPADPDNHIHLLHRIILGTEGGSLMLVNTHGPVLWSPAMYVPDEVKHAFEFDLGSADHLGYPSASVIGPTQTPTYRTILRDVWPAAIGRGLRELDAAIHAGCGSGSHGQYHLALSALWQDLTYALGYPTLRSKHIPHVLPADDLIAAAAEEG